MQRRTGFVVALIGAFALGMLSFAPIARAVGMMALVKCSNAGACTGGYNVDSGFGVLGKSISGGGVWAESQTGNALVATSNKGNGVFAQSFSTDPQKSAISAIAPNYAISAFSTSTSPGSTAAVYGRGAGGYGVTGYSEQSIGIEGSAATSYGMEAETNATSNGAAALHVIAQQGAGLIYAEGPAGTTVFSLANTGDLTIAGKIHTSGSCSSGCSVHRRVQSYEAAVATPTLEDTGEAELAFGFATVRIDPAFANAADLRRGYFVLITPEGDTRGLYVVRRTPESFTVRENENGRSSVAFAYRIVAHPFGSNESRLPFVNLTSSPARR